MCQRPNADPKSAPLWQQCQRELGNIHDATADSPQLGRSNRARAHHPRTRGSRSVAAVWVTWAEPAAVEKQKIEVRLSDLRPCLPGEPARWPSATVGSDLNRCKLDFRLWLLPNSLPATRGQRKQDWMVPDFLPPPDELFSVSV